MSRNEPAPELLDLEARRVALTEQHLGLVVEAGAGSGKTAILAGRVALLLARGAEPATIAAITFTELAAAELALRIGDYVHDLAQGKVPTTLAAAFPAGAPTEQQRTALLAAQERLDELTCTTIHGFARELVRPYPVEANLDPGAGVLEPAEQKLLFAEVFQTWLREVLGETPAGSRAAGDEGAAAVSTTADRELGAVARFVMANEKNKRETLEEIARHVLRRPEASVACSVDLVSTAARASAAGTMFYEHSVAQPGAAALLGDLLAAVPGFVRQLEGLGSDLESAVRVLNLDRPPDLFTQSGTLRKIRVKVKWVAAGVEAGLSKTSAEATFALALEQYQELEGALDELCAGAADLLLHALVEELKEVGRRYQLRKREAAALDFDDLIYTALHLLRTYDSLRDDFAQRFQHVLIDEFQDTDPLQAEIVWRITGQPSEADWRTWPSRPGSRFVVGDPKQSIYRFRGADASTYAQLTQSLNSDPGSKALELSTNFRSVSTVLTTVNATFEAPLQQAGQPGYRPLHSWRTDAPMRGVARLQVPDPTATGARTNVEQLREAEAEAVAALVMDLITGSSDLLPRAIDPGGIALLAPVGSGLDVYERALDAVQVNVASQAGKGFFRRQEVQDLVALTRVLADPRDRLALGALLKGPLVGATDEELLDATDLLNDLEGDQRYVSVLTDPALLPVGGIRRTLERLQPLGLERFSTTPYVLLSRALDALDVRAVLGHRHGDHADRALANVERFLEHSRAFGTRGLTAFAQHVWAQWADGESELEGRTDSAGQSVTLITIHSAKGLEWPVVIPINMVSSPRAVSGVLYDRYTNTVAAKLFGQPCSDYERVREQESDELAAERMRLWYVAATRARDLLVVPQHEAKTTDSAWCNMLEWLPADAPVVSVEARARSRQAPAFEMHTAQSRAQFLDEARLIEDSLVHIERRAPSRRDEEAPASDEHAPPAEAEARFILDEDSATGLLSRLEAHDGLPPEAERRVHIGTARGILLHKLMEELINGETEGTATALADRAADLVPSLKTVGEPLNAEEVAELALRSWQLPEVSALKDRLLAEVEVAGVEQVSTADGRTKQVYWGGVADAVALADDGTVDVVIDWKSDRNPNQEVLEHYKDQLRAYLRLTGATKGLLVLAQSGRVEHVVG